MKTFTKRDREKGVGIERTTGMKKILARSQAKWRAAYFWSGEEARVKWHPPRKFASPSEGRVSKTEMNSTVAEEGVSPEGLLRFCARDGRRMTTAHKRVLGAGCVQSIPQNTITRFQDPPAHHPLQWV